MSHGRGWRQRAALAGEQRAESESAKALVADFSYGEISAAKVQRYAAKAVKDGIDHPTLTRLAGLGNNGAYFIHQSKACLAFQ